MLVDVNISSVAGRVSLPFSSVYDATKHALEAISDGLRNELAPFGIRVIVIQPGFVTTEFSQMADELSQPVTQHLDVYRWSYSRRSCGDRQLKRFVCSPEHVGHVISRATFSRRPKPRYAVPIPRAGGIGPEALLI